MDMKKITAILLGGILFFASASCRKNKSLDLNPDVNVSNDVILSVSSYTNIFNLLIKARLDPLLASQGFSFIDSAYTTYDPVKREYDFSFNSLISPDSVRRSGQITVLVSGDMLQKDSYAKVYFQNYYEDYGRVGGTDSITNLGVNNSGQMVFSDIVSDGFMEKVVGGGTIKVKMTNTCKTMASSLIPGGNVLFYIRGNSSGVSSKGYAFSASVRDSLQDSFSCPWIKGGVIDVQVPDGQVTEGYIDFVSGDGCSDVIWYYFDTSKFKVYKNQFFLKN
jgi:hypothetical protein